MEALFQMTMNVRWGWTHATNTLFVLTQWAVTYVCAFMVMSGMVSTSVKVGITLSISNLPNYASQLGDYNLIRIFV